MAVFLNPELATSGLIYQIIKQKKIEHGKDFTLEHVNRIPITPQIVANYVSWLTYSDCGPIISGFNENKLLSVFENNARVLKKMTGGQYIISFDPAISDLNPNAEDFMCRVFELLITEFQPKMNYQRKFIDFIVDEFEPVREKTKNKLRTQTIRIS